MGHQSAASRVRVFAAGAVALAVALTVLAASASAATFTATDTASFATALASAKSTPGANTITLAAANYTPKATVDLTNTTGPLTIQGPPAVATIDAPVAQFDASSVQPPGSPMFKIETGVTVTFVAVSMTNGGGNGAPAVDDFGIANFAQSSIVGNIGAGLFVEPNAATTIVNSTLSDGGDFGLIDQGTATLTNTTVARNAVGGIDNANGSLKLINTIVAKNGSPDCTATVAAANTDHSLDGDSTCGVGALSGKDPKLGPINSYGGPTPTDAPAAGSPVLDAGDPAACPGVDQRGATRPDDAGTPCDIGSVERYSVAPVLTGPGNITATTASPSGKAVTYTATFTPAGSPVNPKTQSCVPTSGSTFTIGTTTVNCTATDLLGNKGTGSFTVTVNQGTASSPPVIITPGATTAKATDKNGAIVTYMVTATDAVDGPTPVTCTPASGSTFPLGATTVNCTSTNSSNLTATASFTITVTDQTPPVITVPPNMTVAATTPTVVTYSASAVDNVDGTVPVTCVPASGSTFPVGATTVTCNAADKAGNAAVPATFQVSLVADQTPPVITTAGDLTATATSAAGAAVSYTATANDNIDGSVAVTCTPASGTTFKIGATTVTCSASDKAGNVGTASFTVTVVDKTLPVITVPADITLEATSGAGAFVTYAATATDMDDGALAPSCTPASGTTFPVGVTTVSCSATDASLNMSVNSFKVTVTDTTPPVITVPAALTVSATSTAGAAVKFTVTAADIVDVNDTPTCVPASGAAFPVGTTTVTCNATDKAGNLAAPASFTVTVKPYVAPGPPVITVPPDRTLGADSATGVVVTYTVTATDKVDGNVSVSCSPASGATFAVGTTTVACTSTDSGGRTATKSFSIIVLPPFVPTHAKITSVRTSGANAIVALACTGPSSETCDVTLSLLTASAAGARHARTSAKSGGVIATTDVSLAGGKKKRVTLRLSKGSTYKLQQRHTLTVLLALTQTDANGNPTTKTRRLVFRVAAAASAPSRSASGSASPKTTIRFTG